MLAPFSLSDVFASLSSGLELSSDDLADSLKEATRQICRVTLDPSLSTLPSIVNVSVVAFDSKHHQESHFWGETH